MGIYRFELDEISTLIVGIAALFVGRVVRQALPFLRRIEMPNAVVGAVIVAVLVLLGHVFLSVDVAFGARTRDALLLVFFTTIGLSAKLSALRARQAVIDPLRGDHGGADRTEHR